MNEYESDDDELDTSDSYLVAEDEIEYQRVCTCKSEDFKIFLTLNRIPLYKCSECGKYYEERDTGLDS